MSSEISVPKKHQWLFWIILASFSTFFAEVFSGSDMFPFFHPWGLFVVVPLYGLHIILLASLVYRADKPRFASLVFADQGTLGSTLGRSCHYRWICTR